MNITEDEFINNKDIIGEIVSKKEIEIIDNVNKKNLGVLSNGQTETASKKLTTYIIKVDSKYRYKASLVWKNIPSTRSYDILGIGKNSNVSISSGITFQQNYCYTNGSCTSNNQKTVKSLSTGASSIFKLPSGTLSSLSSYMYYDVSKNTNSTITSQKAYGDYSHATKSISLANAQLHTIGTSGIVLNNSILNYYDAIPTATATWSGSW